MCYDKHSKRARAFGGKFHFSKLITQKLNMYLLCYLIVFAMLGMLSPASRGSLMTAIIFLYVFMG